MQLRVAYPYPSQTKISHPSQKKKEDKITTLARIWYQTRIKTHPLPDCLVLGLKVKTTPFPDRNREKRTLARLKTAPDSQTEIVKNIPLRAAHPRYTKRSQSPPTPLGIIAATAAGNPHGGGGGGGGGGGAGDGLDSPFWPRELFLVTRQINLLLRVTKVRVAGYQ